MGRYTGRGSYLRAWTLADTYGTTFHPHERIASHPNAHASKVERVWV